MAQHRERLLARVGGRSDEPAVATPSAGDRYALKTPLGVGGLGEVWAAEHTGIGKTVAVKFLRADLARDAGTRRRFVREGRLASAVVHENVVSVTDVGTADGRPFLVMEFLRGQTLARLIQREGPLPWSRARGILLQLTRALAAAHCSGVIHRDIKPSNIMMVEGHTDGDFCKVIDFGLASGQLSGPDGGEVSVVGKVFGSPAYMSPEQFKGEPADARSDVYGLGCVAYHMLAGHRPFDGATPEGLMYQHLFEPLPNPGAISAPAAWVGQIQAVLRKATEKHADERYPKMNAFAAAVEAVGADPEPLASTPPTRRRVYVAMGAAGAVALAFGATNLFAPPRVDRPSPDVRAEVPGTSLPAVAAQEPYVYRSTARQPGPTPNHPPARPQGVTADPPAMPAPTVPSATPSEPNPRPRRPRAASKEGRPAVTRAEAIPENMDAPKPAREVSSKLPNPFTRRQ